MKPASPQLSFTVYSRYRDKCIDRLFHDPNQGTLPKRLMGESRVGNMTELLFQSDGMIFVWYKNDERQPAAANLGVCMW
jgi:hypothetical protein